MQSEAQFLASKKNKPSIGYGWNSEEKYMILYIMYKHDTK